MSAYPKQVLRDANGRPLIVFAKGRKLFHAVQADDTAIRLLTLDTLRGLVPLEHKGEPYPPKRAASYWLNKGFRNITPRAKTILRGIVARKPKEPA